MKPFGVKVPDHAVVVERDGQPIGYVWREDRPPRRIDASIAHLAKKLRRYTCMTLDGQVLTVQSQTFRRAERVLKAGIRRRVERAYAVETSDDETDQ